MSANVVTHVRAVMPDRVGLLADVTEALRAAGVNITAIGAYGQEDRGKFMMLVSDNAAAIEALGRLNAEVREERVVAVELADHPGALEEVARKLAEADLNIRWAYATVAPGASTALCVIKTADPDKAASVLG